MVLSILFISCILLGFIFPKSKLVLILQCLVCMVVFSFGTKSPDYNGYYYSFYSISENNGFYIFLKEFEIGYKVINFLFRNIGFDFNQFRLIIFFVSYVLIVSTIVLYTKKINAVFSLYMIFPFCMDCVQIRNFIGSAIIIFSLRYLFANKKNISKYTIGCLVAFCFHNTAFLYMLFLLMVFDLRRFNKYFRYIFISVLVICIIIINFNIPFLSDISYFGTRTSVLTYGFFFFIIYLIYRNSKYIEKFFSIRKIDLPFDKNDIIKFCKIIIIFAPLLIFHFDFFRIIRNVLIFVSIYTVEYIYMNKKLTIKKIIVFLIIVSVFLILLYRSCFYSYETSLWEMIFYNNLL